MACKSNCCRTHGDIPSLRSVILQGNEKFELRAGPDGPVIPISAGCIAVTGFWVNSFGYAFVRQKAGTLHFTASNVCKKHQKKVCSKGEGCHWVHICRELWPVILRSLETAQSKATQVPPDFPHLPSQPKPAFIPQNPWLSASQPRKESAAVLGTNQIVLFPVSTSSPGLMASFSVPDVSGRLMGLQCVAVPQVGVASVLPIQLSCNPLPTLQPTMQPSSLAVAHVGAPTAFFAPTPPTPSPDVRQGILGSGPVNYPVPPSPVASTPQSQMPCPAAATTGMNGSPLPPAEVAEGCEAKPAISTAWLLALQKLQTASKFAMMMPFPAESAEGPLPEELPEGLETQVGEELISFLEDPPTSEGVTECRKSSNPDLSPGNRHRLFSVRKQRRGPELSMSQVKQQLSRRDVEGKDEGIARQVPQP
eukprot:GGOE01022542.1.p1 GENE.GGOE01022542.1~~GGOE01022542.1.p1  ORF type:complete len:421 (+),score=12.55 GGOE01022542.1:26-1288(+)